MDEVTELQDSSVFRLRKSGIWNDYNDQNKIYSIQIQMSMDQTLIERNGYTILDILSDVGGLQEF